MNWLYYKLSINLSAYFKNKLLATKKSIKKHSLYFLLDLTVLCSHRHEAYKLSTKHHIYKYILIYTHLFKKMYTCRMSVFIFYFH